MKHKRTATHSKSKKRRKVVMVIDATATLSPYAKYATTLFRRGVQRAYTDLAKKRVYTVVLKNGLTIRGIPRKVNGKFVVEAKVSRKPVRAAS